MEKVVVAGVAYDKNQAKLTLSGVPDKPGVAAKLFGKIADFFPGDGFGHGLAKKSGCTLIGILETEEDLNGSGFSRAVRPNKPEHGSGSDGYSKIIQSVYCSCR